MPIELADAELTLHQTVTLYRPVGQRELELIDAADRRAFPPRLSWQPIFYPVFNRNIIGQIEVIATFHP